MGQVCSSHDECCSAVGVMVGGGRGGVGVCVGGGQGWLKLGVREGNV